MRPDGDSRNRLASHVTQVRFVPSFVELATFVKGDRRRSDQPICQSLPDTLCFANRLETVHGWHFASPETLRRALRARIQPTCGTDKRSFWISVSAPFRLGRTSKAERLMATPCARGASKLRLVSSTMTGSMS